MYLESINTLQPPVLWHPETYNQCGSALHPSSTKEVRRTRLTNHVVGTTHPNKNRLCPWNLSSRVKLKLYFRLGSGLFYGWTQGWAGEPHDGLLQMSLVVDFRQTLGRRTHVGWSLVLRTHTRLSKFLLTKSLDDPTPTITRHQVKGRTMVFSWPTFTVYCFSFVSMTWQVLYLSLKERFRQKILRDQ